MHLFGIGRSLWSPHPTNDMRQQWKELHIYKAYFPLFLFGRIKGIFPYFPFRHFLRKYRCFPYIPSSLFLDTTPRLFTYSSLNSLILFLIVLSVTPKYSAKVDTLQVPSSSKLISKALSNSNFLDSGVCFLFPLLVKLYLGSPEA